MDNQTDTMLIDGRNSVYRAVFAALASRSTQYTSVLSKLLINYVKKLRPKNVCVMWDYDGIIWRSKKYPQYKNRKEQRRKAAEKYGVDIGHVINDTIFNIKKLMDIFGFKQYEFKFQEADDLIYAYCKCHTEDIVIVSSDGDLVQIPYKLPNTKVFNPLKDSFIPTPTVNPVIMKCLHGDKSDNIQGFKGVGPVKAGKLALDEVERNKFLSEGDGSRLNYYKLYECLIDLDKNPFLNMNLEYIKGEEHKQVNKFDYTEMVKFIRESGLSSLFDDIPRIKKTLECIQG